MNKLLLLAIVFSMTLCAVSCKESAPKDSSTTQSEEITTTTNSNIASSNIKVVATSNNKSITVKTPTQVASTGEMTWSGMGEVEELVKKEPKKIIVDVYTQWCGPCKMMDRNTFSDEAVQKAINEKFHAVKFDAEGAGDIAFRGKTYGNPNHDPSKRGRNSSHELSPFFGVRGYPTLVVLDENFNVLHKLVGYKTPDKLLAEIEAI